MFVKIFVAVCLLAVAYAQQDASEYCMQCQGRRNHKDLYADPDGDCHVFYQCFYMNSTYAIGYRMECAGGTFFNENTLSCMPEGSVPCQSPCASQNVTGGGCFASQTNCAEFWVCTNNGMAFPFCCAPGTSINTTTCTCDFDVSGCTDQCFANFGAVNATTIAPPVNYGNYCVDSYNATLRPSANGADQYENVAADGSYTTMPCPGGTTFFLESCRCEGADVVTGSNETAPTSVPPGSNARQCTLYLPFDVDTKDYSWNKFYVETVGDAQVTGEASAQGEGSLMVSGGHVEIPALKDNNFGVTFSMCYFYQCSGGDCSNATGGHLTNNKDTEKSEFTAISSSSGDDYILDVNFSNGPKSVVVSSASNNSDVNGFKQICINYGETSVTLYINGVSFLFFLF